MKIVDTDNFGGDYPDEQFVAEGITNPHHGKVMVEALNERFSGDHAPRYYKLVSDDYKLAPGFEP